MTTTAIIPAEPQPYDKVREAPDDTLLPCPFCGSDPEIDFYPAFPDEHEDFHCVSCIENSCTSLPSSMGATRNEAIANWNTRIDQEPKPPCHPKLGNVIRKTVDEIQGTDEEQLILALARIVEGKSLHAAFGAPGDWGYDTPIGDALLAVYQGKDEAQNSDNGH